MDISYFFGKNSQHREKKDTKKGRETREKALQFQFSTIVQELMEARDITRLDSLYLRRYSSKAGPLPTVYRLLKIIDGIKSDKRRGPFINLINRMHPNLLDGRKLRPIMKSITEHSDVDLTSHQKAGARDMLKFIKREQELSFGLYGYAGTGKTTLITEMIGPLLSLGLIKSVAFTAPTNKAVNVIKSKIHETLTRLVTERCPDVDPEESATINEQVSRLERTGIRIDFVTIHRLLDYQTDFTNAGGRTFVKAGNSRMGDYDLIVVDECSMIPIQVVLDVIEEGKKQMKSFNYPKVILVGDPAQLPPVNERVSIVFSDELEDYHRPDLMRLLETEAYDADGFFVGKTDNDSIKARLTQLYHDIQGQGNYLLRQIVRAKDTKLVGMCTDMRHWVIGDIPHPVPYKFRGNTVMLYKYNKEPKHLTKWLGMYVDKLETHKPEDVGIILTWTNHQCDEYNTVVRERLFKKDKLKRFEVGDILMMNDFYNITEMKEVIDGDKEKHRFYTSEQIKVLEVSSVTKKIGILKSKFSKSAQRIRGSQAMEDKYSRTLNRINNTTEREYRCWKLLVQRLCAQTGSGTEKKYWIYVPKRDAMKKLEADRANSTKVIGELRRFYATSYRQQMSQIDMEIIKPLWRLWSTAFDEPFANVNYGYCITVHKSQGSTYHNVYIDLNDIFKNRVDNEAKRCAYTALTRASNGVYILV